MFNRKVDPLEGHVLLIIEVYILYIIVKNQYILHSKKWRWSFWSMFTLWLWYSRSTLSRSCKSTSIIQEYSKCPWLHILTELLTIKKSLSTSDKMIKKWGGHLLCDFSHSIPPPSNSGKILYLPMHKMYPTPVLNFKSGENWNKNLSPGNEIYSLFCQSLLKRVRAYKILS